MSNTQTKTLPYLWRPAVYHSSRGGAQVQSILLHATEGHIAGDLETLIGGDGDRHVSVHWLIDRDGTLYHLVDNSQTANHAGAVKFLRYDNHHSLGIENSHRDNLEEWPHAQVETCANLVAFLLQQFGELELVYHKDVAVPKGRKSDPQNYPLEQFKALLTAARQFHWSAVAVQKS